VPSPCSSANGFLPSNITPKVGHSHVLTPEKTLRASAICSVISKMISRMINHALLNPFLLSLVIELLNVSQVLPALANVLSPAWLSVPHLVFFTLSTLVLWSPRVERVPETVYVKPNL
jgi:hypothetical protein